MRSPRSHGATFEIRSSGSTGRPIQVMGTGLTSIYVRALSMRGHLWHQRDLSAKNVDIRTAKTNINPNKKLRWSVVADAGESVLLDINLPIGVLLDQLIREDPVYLQTHPYTLKGLVERSLERGIRPKSLRQVRTFGEVLEAEIRQFQLTQKTVENIEVKLAVAKPLTKSKELQLAHYLTDKFGHPFDYQFFYVDDIPRSANGKYEDFKSELL